MFIKITTGPDNTKFDDRVLAYDGPSGLLIRNREGTQEVPDKPLHVSKVVRKLIAMGIAEEVSKPKSAPAPDNDDPEDTDTDTEEADDLTPLQRLKAEAIALGHDPEEVRKLRSKADVEAMIAGAE